MRGSIAVACLCVSLLAAADWPQWRGPNRDGVLPGVARPAWPEKLKLKWKVKVGEGHSSPVLGAGRIYQFSRLGGNETLRALDPETGKVLWTGAYAAPYKMNSAAVRHGEGPKSTPVFAGGRVYTLGIGGILSAWDAATGKGLWRKEFGGQFKETSPLYGTAMSPLVTEGLVIVHAGGDGDGALSAFDAAGGELKWSWKGDGPGYASPVVAEMGGARQIVTQSEKYLIGVALQNGALLWKIPFTTSYTQNAVTPLVYGDLVIYSGLGNGVTAIRVRNTGKGWATEPVWHTDEVSMYMNSPVIAGNTLVGFSHKNRGQYFGLDPKTGKTLWLGEPRKGENAAIVFAAGALWLLNNDAELLVARATPQKLEVLRKYTVASSPAWAHPLPLEKAVVIKDFEHLTAWALE